MKNRKFLYALLILVLVVAIGVGYAAVTNYLVINGTVKAAALSEDIEGLQFTGATKGTNCASAEVADGGLTGVMVTDSLDAIQEKATATFTVKNGTAYKIRLTELDFGDYDDVHFHVTYSFAEDELEAQATTTVTVTVTLIKIPAEEIEDYFLIKFNGDIIAG